MADYQSSLPVETLLPGDVDVSIYDSTGTNAWAIDANGIGSTTITDGTNTVSIDANGNIGTTLFDAGGDQIAIDASGNLSTIITDGTDTLGINADGSIQIGDGTETLAINTDGSVLAQITDGTDALDVNPDGSINVNVISAVMAGEVHEYGSTVDTAAGATADVVDYTVTAATTLILRGWSASSSGKARAELLVGPAASEVSQAVRFISTSNGGFSETFPEAIEVAAGDKVLVSITNNEPGQATNLYAWINGREIS
jgi:hypothetical protein